MEYSSPLGYKFEAQMKQFESYLSSEKVTANNSESTIEAMKNIGTAMLRNQNTRLESATLDKWAANISPETLESVINTVQDIITTRIIPPPSSRMAKPRNEATTSKFKKTDAETSTKSPPARIAKTSAPETPSDISKTPEVSEVEAKPVRKIVRTRRATDSHLVGTKVPFEAPIINQEPEQFTRLYPPKSPVDTRGKAGRSETPISFNDADILDVHHCVATKMIGRKVKAYLSEHGKWVIQQQSLRGCTAAVSAMLILDNGGGINESALPLRNLGKGPDNCKDIENAGLSPVMNNVKNLEELKALIEENGSAIVDVTTNVGSHVVVVDAIFDDSVRIRDPLHNWEISMKLEAFKRAAFGGGMAEVVQVKQN